MFSYVRFKIILSAVAVLLISMALLITCSKDNPTSSEDEATWSLTVNVTDGYTGVRLPGVHVSYANKGMKDTFALTNAQGQAKIVNLDDGAHNFTVSFTDSTNAKYTNVLWTMTSTSDTSGLKKLADRIETVKIYPLTGSISGKIVSQRHDLAAKVPVSALTVGLTFSNPDLKSNTTFQTKTDSLGAFKFTGLPLSSGMSFAIPNVSVGGIDYKVDSIPALVLQSKVSVPVGSIYMHPIGSGKFKLTSTIPKSISPNQTISLIYSDTLDTASYAIFEGANGSQTVQTKKSITGITFSITPTVSLTGTGTYYLIVNAFGKSGGSQISKDTLIVAGSGIVDIISSSVLDVNHQVIDGLGLSDSMTFTFRTTIAAGTATVSKGETIILTDVVVRDNTLIIKPKSSWEPGTYSVKVTATLSDSTTSQFVFNIATVGGLDFVSSNIYNPQSKTAINGLKFNDTIRVVANKTLKAAQVTLSVVNPATAIPVTVTVSGATVLIIPTDNLRTATAYAFSITVSTDKGESKSFSIPSTAPFTTANSNFFPVADNIRNESDPAKPLLTFPPNGTIIIKMSSEVKAATAQINAGTEIVPTIVTARADSSIIITPTTNFKEGVGYSLQVSAESNLGEFYTEKNFVTNFYVKNTFIPLSSNIRIDNAPRQPVLDFPPNGQIVIIMSDSVKTCTAALLNGTAVVGTRVITHKDTIRIIPDDLLSASISYSLSLAVENYSGLKYHAEADPYFVTGLRVRTNLVRVIASNVLTTDGIGITNVPLTIVPFYVLSATPNPQSLAVNMYTGRDTVNSTVTIKGDTIFVAHALNFIAGKQYKVTIKGKTTTSDPIDIDLTTDNKVFSSLSAVIIVASNMRDANGNPVSNLLPSTELWIKFSRPLSTDITMHQLGGGVGKTAVYRNGATNNNVIIRISGDTLFAKYQLNTLPNEGDSISLRGITLLFADATTLGPDAVNLKAYILKRPTPYVIATNGVVNNVVVDTFNTLAEAWIVSNLPFLSVDAIKNGPDGLASVTASNLLISNVRTHGDTIFFKPAVRLNYDSVYQVAFNVTLRDSSKYTGSDLKLKWKTEKGTYLISSNDMQAGFQTRRPFSLTGDSLVLTFSKVIDITQPFSVGGLTTGMTYSWSNGNKTLTAKPTDTLKSKPYAYTGGYSLTDAAQYGPITISLTTMEGEIWTTKATNTSAIFKNARPGIAIHTIMGLEVLNTSLKVSSANKSQYYINSENRKMSDLIASNQVAQNDSVGRDDTLKLYFSAAIDNAAIAASTSMIRLTTGTGPNPTVVPFTVSYAASNKTVLINPNATLGTVTTYTLTLNNVKGLGYNSADTNGDISYTFVFKTRPRLLTTAQVQLYADTARTPEVFSKRMGYSGSIGDAYDKFNTNPNSLNPADVPPLNTVKLIYSEVAFHSESISDTVSHYQFSVLGVNNIWYTMRNLIPAHHYTTAAPDSLRRDSLNLSAIYNYDYDINNVRVGPLLRVSPRSYQHNDACIFNNGTTLHVRIRPVLSANNQWDATDKGGTWSSELIFQDNVAPCDTDYVANATDPSRLQNVSRGGVDDTLISRCPLDRSGPLPDSTFVFTFTFPEDMDTTTKPELNVWYGGIPPSVAIEADNIRSSWNGTAYSYRLIVKIPGGVDWTPNGQYKPYYAISIAGMKDASGVTIQSWGDTHNAGHGTPLPANSRGTVNTRGLLAF